MHQLHQLHEQFIFVKTCSDKESSDGFITANQKKTEVIDGKLYKSYQSFYQAAFQERAHIFQVTLVLSQDDIKEIQDSPPVLCDTWLQSLKS